MHIALWKVKRRIALIIPVGRDEEDMQTKELENIMVCVEKRKNRPGGARY